MTACTILHFIVRSGAWSPFTAASGDLLPFTVRSGGCYHFTVRSGHQHRAPARQLKAPSTSTQRRRPVSTTHTASSQHWHQRPLYLPRALPAPSTGTVSHTHLSSTSIFGSMPVVDTWNGRAQQIGLISRVPCQKMASSTTTSASTTRAASSQHPAPAPQPAPAPGTGTPHRHPVSTAHQHRQPVSKAHCYLK